MLNEIRVALWAFRATRAARRQMTTVRWNQVRIPPPPDAPASAERGVRFGLHRAHATCLVDALVRQEWYRAHGTEREVVIGITAPRRGFEAHAWLEGDPPCHEKSFTELMRSAPPSGS